MYRVEREKYDSIIINSVAEQWPVTEVDANLWDYEQSYIIVNL